MVVGLSPTKADFDQRLGTQSLQVLQIMSQWTQLKAKIDAMQDSELTTLGYSTADITLIRATMTDTGTIVAIFTGNATLTNAYDFRTHISQLAGMGY